MKLIKRNTYYDPFTELEKLHEDMHRLFGGESVATPERSFGLLDTGWAPAIDVYEAKDKLVVKADLPGLKKEDIDVTIENNVLTIRGEKKHEEEVKKEEYVRTERFYGAFHRSCDLPAVVDVSKVTAEYKNGTLTLELQKKEEAKPKQISVQIQ